MKKQKLLILILMLIHMSALNASWFSDCWDKVKDGVSTVVNTVISVPVQAIVAAKIPVLSGAVAGVANVVSTVTKQAVATATGVVQAGQDIVQGHVGTGLTELTTAAGTGALTAVEYVAAAPLIGVAAVAGAAGGGDITQSALDITGSIASGAGNIVGQAAVMIGTGVEEGVVGTVEGLIQTGKGIGKLVTGDTSGFSDIGQGLANTITQAGNIVLPLPIQNLAPGAMEGIQRTFHGAEEIAGGHFGDGFTDLGMGASESLLLGSNVKGFIETGSGLASGNWNDVGNGLLQAVSLNEPVKGITDIANGGNIAEGLSRAISIGPVTGGMIGSAAMGITKSGEAIATGIQQGQGFGAVAGGALGALFTGSATYGLEALQGTTSESELLTGKAEPEQEAAGALTYNLPPGFTPETDTTFCVAVGSSGGQLEAWSISPQDPTTGADKLLRYDATQTQAKSPWQIIPTVDDQGNVITTVIWVSVSSDGNILIIDNQGIVYSFNPDKKNFTAFPIGYAYTYDTTKKTFTRTENGLAFNMVSIGNKNEIWGVDSAANIIYSYDTATTTWTPRASGIRVSAGVDGTVIAIDNSGPPPTPETGNTSTGAPIRYVGDGKWVPLGASGTKLDHIAVGSKDYILGSYQGGMWQYANNAWTQVNGKDGTPAFGVYEIAVNAAGTIFITDFGGNIYNKGDQGVVITQKVTPLPSAAQLAAQAQEPILADTTILRQAIAPATAGGKPQMLTTTIEKGPSNPDSRYAEKLIPTSTLVQHIKQQKKIVKAKKAQKRKRRAPKHILQRVQQREQAIPMKSQVRTRATEQRIPTKAEAIAAKQALARPAYQPTYSDTGQLIRP